MMKKLVLSGVCLAMLTLTGCGGSSSDEKSARDILVGKTLYTADESLDEPSGYYQDVYQENMVIETEHAEDGTQIYQPFNIPVSYAGNNIIVTLGDTSVTCKVSEVTNAVIFECDDNRNFQQWYTTADIVR